jgi:hypothetical protein
MVAVALAGCACRPGEALGVVVTLGAIILLFRHAAPCAAARPEPLSKTGRLPRSSSTPLAALVAEGDAVRPFDDDATNDELQLLLTRLWRRRTSTTSSTPASR